MNIEPIKEMSRFRGWPNPALLPSAEASATVMASPNIRIMLYDPVEGYYPFREYIAQRLTSSNPSTAFLPASESPVPPICMLQVFTDHLCARIV
ncbi:hypothetical protein BDV25DRAFT_80491 [Aspergillus avenaceus]|uniref:Uncharacterized protein n=1 Tax=Aspergillus avenaceus TaxID=36643 RepID=A0A5N6TZY0_ASPAV|nr:hypothetical protein BDV25DRAFT_80491 [Aspergillus avenaceus]